MVSFEFRRNVGDLDNNKLTHVETKSSFSTDISVCNDASNTKDKIDFDDCELGDVSSDFSDSSAYEDLKDIDPSNFRLSPQHTISPKRDIEDFQSIASPNSAENFRTQDYDPSYDLENHLDGQFLECEGIPNQDESLTMDIVIPQLEKLTENDLQLDTIGEDTTRTLHTDDRFTEYTNVVSSRIENTVGINGNVEINEHHPEDDHDIVAENIYDRLCATPLESSQVIANSATVEEDSIMEKTPDSVSSSKKNAEQSWTENTLIRMDTDISAIVDINSNKEDYEKTIKIYKDLLGEELISSTELNYEKLDHQSISDRLYHYISKVVSDSPTSNRNNGEFKTPESNTAEENAMDVIVEPEMLDPKATGTMDNDPTPTIENSDKQDIYYFKGDNLESIPFPNISDNASDTPTFRSAYENTELESSKSNEEEWDISRGMISANTASLVNGSLRSIKVLVGSNLFNNTDYVLSNHTSSLSAGYSPVYDETRKLMQNFTAKLKKINSLRRKFDEICFRNENFIVERNRLTYCLLASNSNKLVSIISQYKKLIELKNHTIITKRNNIVKMRKKIVESICKRQSFKKIQPKIELLESLKCNLANIHKSTGIKVIPIVDQNSFLKTIFVVSFNENSDMRFLSDTYTNPWLNTTILKTKRLEKLLSLSNGNDANPCLGVNATIHLKSPNHTTSKESSVDSMFQNTHSSNSKFSYGDAVTDGSLIASHRTIVDHSPYSISKRGVNEDRIHSIITPRNKNNIHSSSESLKSSQTIEVMDAIQGHNLEDFIPIELNWDENVDILRLKHDLCVTLYVLKPNNHYGFSVWYEFNSVLLNMFNKFLKNVIETFLGELEESPNLFQLLRYLVRTTSNLAARIRIISRELYQWISITNAHSFQYDGSEFKIRSMISSDGSKPCLWCNFGINMNGIHTRKTILESVNEIKVELVHERYKETIVNDINRSLKSNIKHNRHDLCTFVKSTCKLHGYIVTPYK